MIIYDPQKATMNSDFQVNFHPWPMIDISNVSLCITMYHSLIIQNLHFSRRFPLFVHVFAE